MSSSRAQAVADVLYELKQAEKLGTLTGVARRAGFNPGVNGKTALNVLETVPPRMAPPAVVACCPG